jgi:hypothetical protein
MSYIRVFVQRATQLKIFLTELSSNSAFIIHFQENKHGNS